MFSGKNQNLSRLRQKTPAIRVAARWLWASITTEYDILIRLQLLEGVAGVPEGKWAKSLGSGRAGLSKAQAALAGNPIQEIWFSESNTGALDVFQGIVRKFIVRNHLHSVDAFDVINNMLMGIGLEGSVKPFFYGSGENENIRKSILSGKVTPKSLSTSVLGSWFTKKMINIVGRIREDVGQKEDIGQSESLERELESPSEHSPTEALVGLIFDRHSTLGSKVRDLMRMVWNSPSKPPLYKEFMNKWLEHLEKGELTDANIKRNLIDIAKEVGVSTDYHTAYWKPAWKDFIKALWHDDTLLKEIHREFVDEGIDWFNQVPDLSKIGSASLR